MCHLSEMLKSCLYYLISYLSLDYTIVNLLDLSETNIPVWLFSLLTTSNGIFWIISSYIQCTV